MARDVGAEAAREVGLTYVNDHDPGLRRSVSRQGMDYFDAEGRPVRDPETLDRIAHLAIPPAWTDVWICPDPNGHIQAVGRDARGRKQYRYHDAWRAHRDDAKYHRLCAFGRALPRLRRRIEADLAGKTLSRERVLAAVTRLLEITLIRVGNDEYVKQNKSFGLTTLRKRHVTLTGVGAVFEFRGKSGKIHKTGFHDRRLARVLARFQELPGQRLFKYVDADGELRPVESADVNAYLHEAMGEDFSAKDFRTWAGTLLAARALAMHPPPGSGNDGKHTLATCVKAVAGMLGNTAAICRRCYIHPAVFDAWRAGALSPRLTGEARVAELALLKLLQDAGACD
jgi:DNA topoisomerase-1